MKRYKVVGLGDEGAGAAVARAIRARLGDAAAFEIIAQDGEVRVAASEDPMRVTFAIESAGYRVVNVSG